MQSFESRIPIEAARKRNVRIRTGYVQNQLGAMTPMAVGRGAQLGVGNGRFPLLTERSLILIPSYPRKPVSTV